MKKWLQYLYLPLISLVLIPALMFLLLFGCEYAIQEISVLLYFLLGGYVLYKIEHKKQKIFSVIFTILLHIALGILVLWACDVSCQGGFFGYFFLPATYFDYFFIDETIGKSILFVLIAPLPVLMEVIAAKLFSIKQKWSKWVIALLVVALLVSVGVKTGVVLKDRYQHGYSWFGETEVYFDRYGNEYACEEDVIYYDRDGHQYHIENYDLVDEQGNRIDISSNADEEIDVYIGADGYLYIDREDVISWRSDTPMDDYNNEWDYCDEYGNIYARYYHISFLRDGTPTSEFGDEFRDGKGTSGKYFLYNEDYEEEDDDDEEEEDDVVVLE